VTGGRQTLAVKVEVPLAARGEQRTGHLHMIRLAPAQQAEVGIEFDEHGLATGPLVFGFPRIEAGLNRASAELIATDHR
jgi:hypothetical protein